MRKGLFLIPISAAAFVATWGGWVGLGEMTGFGSQNLLPGFVADGKWSTVNLVITLPLMVESYAAYAMSVWFSPASSRRARAFAGVSSVVSLLLAAIGQISFHVLESQGVTVAPIRLTGMVSVLPVLVLGMAAALHLLSRDAPETSHASSLGRLWDAAARAAERRIERLGETPPVPVETSRETSPPPSLVAPAGTPVETIAVPAAPSRPAVETPETPAPLDVPAGTARGARPWAALPRDKRVAAVGAMRAELPRPSYAVIAGRLGISKAEAARLGQAAADRKSLEPDPVPLALAPPVPPVDAAPAAVNGYAYELESVS